MVDILIDKLNTAEKYTEGAGGCIVIHLGGATSIASSQGKALGPVRNRGLSTLADSSESAWVIATFRPTVASISGIEYTDSAGLFIASSEALQLQLRDDLASLPLPVRRSEGSTLCRQFVEKFGNLFASLPQTRCAVFGDEEDGIELIAHSRASKRQVSFEFVLAGEIINIIRIDECMHQSEQSCGIDKVRTLSEAIAWLKQR